MKMWRSTLVTLAIAATCCAEVYASRKTQDPTSRISVVEEVSRRELGIGLNEVSALLGLVPGAVYPKNSIQFGINKKYFDSLKKDGYVVTEENEKFISVGLTEKGKKLQNAIRNQRLPM